MDTCFSHSELLRKVVLLLSVLRLRSSPFLGLYSGVFFGLGARSALPRWTAVGEVLSLGFVFSKYWVALPEIIEKPCFLVVSWKQGGRVGGEGGRDGSTVLTVRSRLVGALCFVSRADRQCGVVTRIGANTTPINNNKKVRKQTVRN